MKKNFILLLLILLSVSLCAQPKQKGREKTAFQTSTVWSPEVDVQADVAIVYGVKTQDHLIFEGKPISFADRVKSWRDKGYITHFMTGIAWGEYRDYFNGEWDGKTHYDEGQQTMEGDTIWHHPGVPYIVPTQNFLTYMKEKHIKPVIDLGIDAIYLEEPEFWAFAGYSEAFKREWKAFYGTEWQAQHQSAENLYLSNKLKYHLYYRAVDECFTFAKEYGKKKGMNVRCYVPTHSLINYSQWHIVSPEASLASLPSVDGYIAQVWTGTSRVPNYNNGLMKERVFETAFMEYGCMESMTAPTGRKVFFLTDPIEDRPRDWDDYKKNYEATFTAKLLYPQNANFEVMPWPERIYQGLYNKSADSEEQIKIPRFFSTQMQIMINSLGNMPLSGNTVTGSKGISVLMSNSLMFQRNTIPVEGYEDLQLSNFFGLVMPLLKKGIPVHTVHIENVGYEAALADTKVLLMTYSNMKPLDPKAHTYLAQWVKNGGILVFSGADKDPFQTVEEWWNTKGNSYHAPSEHLFEQMNIASRATEGEYKVGKGKVYVLRTDPQDYVMKNNNSHQLVGVVKKLYESLDDTDELQFKNHFYLERGVYDLVSVLDESVSAEPYVLKGTLIDMFDPQLPVYKSKEIAVGEQGYFLNIDRVVDKNEPQVLAAASRTYDEKVGSNTYSYIAKSPINTTNVSRVLLPTQPSSIKVDGKEVYAPSLWDATSKTYLLTFENNPKGVIVDVKW